MHIPSMSLLAQATNAVWIPWNALHIAGYEQAKRAAAAAAGVASPEQLPPWVLGACSAGDEPCVLLPAQPAALPADYHCLPWSAAPSFCF